jgi:hypothetical protein
LLTIPDPLQVADRAQAGWLRRISALHSQRAGCFTLRMSKQKLPPEALAFFAKHGSKGGKIGGKAKGPTKARTSAQARKAVKTRWAKAKARAKADPKNK